MFGRIATKLSVLLLKYSRISIEDRIILTASVLDKLQALPLRDIIKFNEEGILLVNGRTLTSEGKAMLREGAKTLLNNATRKMIHEQVAFAAISIGVHNGQTPEQLMFARSAIWYGQQEDILLRKLAQIDDTNDVEEDAE